MKARAVFMGAAGTWCLAACTALAAAAEPAGVEGRSRVAAVLVMADRAVVTRLVECDLPAGRSVIVVDGLLPGLDERTLKCLPAGETKGLTVVDLASDVYEKLAPARADLAGLETERNKLSQDIRVVEDDIVAVQERTRVLGEYRTLSSQAMKAGLLASAPDVDEWRKASEFVSAEALAATVKIREMEKRKYELTESQKELDARIAGIRNPSGTKVRRARIAVDCRAATAARLELSYLVRDKVRWGPQYELRLDRGAGKVEMTSLAAVAQETGEDWAAASLTFSTRSPAKGLRGPVVSPVFLGAAERPSRSSTLSSVEVKEDVRLDAPAATPRDGAAEGPRPLREGSQPPPVGAAPAAAPKPADGVPELRAGGETAEFAAREVVSVPSDGQPALVPLGRWTAGCKWHLESVPKLLGSIYIRGSLANPTGVVMLPGPGDCYVDEEYVGKVAVPLTPGGGTADLSFGAVEGLSVSRSAEPLESKRRGTLRGGGRNYQYAYTMELANATAKPVEVSVIETIPVSTVKAVVVELDAETTPCDKLEGGRLRWRVGLAPGERKQIRLRYSVDIGKEYKY